MNQMSDSECRAHFKTLKNYQTRLDKAALERSESKISEARYRTLRQKIISAQNKYLEESGVVFFFGKYFRKQVS